MTHRNLIPGGGPISFATDAPSRPTTASHVVHKVNVVVLAGTVSADPVQRRMPMICRDGSRIRSIRSSRVESWDVSLATSSGSSS
jgi:hypothetical protein